MTPSELPPAWRDRAEQLRRFAPSAAEAFGQAAEELEAALRERAAEVLTLPEAAKESGYSTDRLAELIREGAIPNAGRKHAPRIRRADLPRKPRPPAQPQLARGGPARASLARIQRDAAATRSSRR